MVPWVETEESVRITVSFEQTSEGLIHVWHQFAGMIPEGTESVHEVGQWIAARAGRP